MIWIKLPHGDKWHMLDKDGEVFCLRRLVRATTHVDSSKEEAPPWDERCENCDRNLRESGNPTKKPTRKTPYLDPKTNYRPKTKVKWD